jgi:hypothetical protein
MPRPRKPDSELKAPRRLKTPDGKPIRGKGRPKRLDVEVKVKPTVVVHEEQRKPTIPEAPKADATVKVTLTELKTLIAMTGNTPPPVTTVSAEGEVVERTNFTPLEYALHVMNDPNAPREQRDRLAIAALPFCHVKRGEGGKKEQVAENAEKAAGGKFGASQPPRLKAV